MTVGRLRLLVGRTGRRVGPVLVTAIAVATAGLGLHAAVDWHHHGELGAGFFHIHVFFGEHEHSDLDEAGHAQHHHAAHRHHHHAEHDHHGRHDLHDHDVPAPGQREEPEPGSHHHRRNVGVLAMAFGLEPASPAATASTPDFESCERVAPAPRRLTDRHSFVRAWSPRGPPG